jgi:hypothetical protein
MKFQKMVVNIRPKTVIFTLKSKTADVKNDSFRYFILCFNHLNFLKYHKKVPIFSINFIVVTFF